MQVNQKVITKVFLYIFFIFPSLLMGKTEEKKPINVMWFGQTKKEVWGSDFLGTSKILTLHLAGCAVTSSSMVINYYGNTMNPRQLNTWLVKNNGFVEGFDDETGKSLGLVGMKWSVLAEKMEEVASYTSFSYKDSPADLELIRSYLDRDIPVIVETLRPKGIQHFVVLTGYIGDDFYMEDPLNENSILLSDVYNTEDEYGSGASRNIYGARIFSPKKSLSI